MLQLLHQGPIWLPTILQWDLEGFSGNHHASRQYDDLSLPHEKDRYHQDHHPSPYRLLYDDGQYRHPRGCRSLYHHERRLLWLQRGLSTALTGDDQPYEQV